MAGRYCNVYCTLVSDVSTDDRQATFPLLRKETIAKTLIQTAIGEISDVTHPAIPPVPTPHTLLTSAISFQPAADTTSSLFSAVASREKYFYRSCISYLPRMRTHTNEAGLDAKGYTR